MVLGLLEGSPVRVTRRAIGGDPIEVNVMGYALSLRQAEAALISVDPARP
jgi:ferrous iron transport protein A